ncbi:Lrp/AsnC family transcriptional regulator [Streptomyces olivaceus]|uniref:Lrp/AsnC family transcriptional regulator n=1 Tax=Streptomyces olivaceus TaxID=47716 RepID=A0ABS7W478_STROV|nr:Lrp/AsnC family transcriptional regulator [Streptomyces olivaceus]MBZ6089962.1 Lrp/AsnC family transcriptional regulator [Streptomyces olivaceus]MBZ6098473.1 Lrp/AsnC family transcriptional regulator [Streptomyces olivaceus]MBZ6119276.1 Lrp/AsnC family transcriptional regulator [Streptomyces olivaceus]MBZ6151991.1 Lrp/AsnC family transcriptional regulator [Streptomyces olivaceus]MBZ6300542.1 Lrp/AsnC family transcriptional regulator [Streptomyces olivaceus]
MNSHTLDPLDRQLVHALQIEGRAPFSHVAEVLDVSDQTVARRYRKLRDSGAMRVLGLPDAGRFGHIEWLVRVQCTPDASSSVATALAKRDDTSWVSLTAGGTEIVCVTRAPHRADGESLLLQKLPRTPRVVAVTAHYILHTYSGGPTGWHGKAQALTARQAKLLSPRLPPPPPRREHVEMRDGDAGLFAALAADGRAGYPELAAFTGWSESTVKRRLEYLRDTRALFFDVEIDSVLLGYEAQVMLWLAVPPTELVNVAAGLAGHPEVVFAAATTGPTNLVAIVVCRDIDSFYDYLTTRIGALEAVSRVETAPVISAVKRAGRLLPSTRHGNPSLTGR